MVSDSDDAYIRGVFPEIDQIRDKDLARKVVEIWAEMWHESEWDRIEDCPKSPRKDGDLKVVPHIRSMTAVALAIADSIKRFHGAVNEVDTDAVLIGAMLHDVDKLLIYAPRDGAVTESRFAKTLPHGTYTGYKMMEKGFPIELVNLVIAHSANATSLAPMTLEGLIVANGDRAESEVMHFFGPQPK
jgi:hypothetical protein